MQATTVTLVSDNDLTKSPSSRQEPTPKETVQKKQAPKSLAPLTRPIHKESKPVTHKQPAPRLIKKTPMKRTRLIRKTSPVKHKLVEKRHPHSLEKVLPRTKSSLVKKDDHPSNPMASKNPVSPVKSNVPVKMDMVGQRFPSYLQHLLISRIKSNWAPPPGSHGLGATVRFVLRKNGTLEEDPVLVTPSGSTVFDEAAKFAILRSVPFPPFPPSYGKDQEVVTVTLQATKRQGF